MNPRRHLISISIALALASAALAQTETRLAKSFEGHAVAEETADGKGIVGARLGSTFPGDMTPSTIALTTPTTLTWGHVDLLVATTQGGSTRYSAVTGRWSSAAAGTVSLINSGGDEITNAVRVRGMRTERQNAAPDGAGDVAGIFTANGDSGLWQITDGSQRLDSASYSTASDELFDVTSWSFTISAISGDPTWNLLLVAVPFGGQHFVEIARHHQIAAANYGTAFALPLSYTLPPGHDIYCTTDLPEETEFTGSCGFAGIARISSSYRSLGALVPQHGPEPDGDT